jgi:hypothetical protein
MTITPTDQPLPPGIKAYRATDEWPLLVSETAPRGTIGVMVWEPPFAAVLAAMPTKMLETMIAAAATELGVDDTMHIERKTVHDTHLVFFVKPD